MNLLRIAILTLWLMGSWALAQGQSIEGTWLMSWTNEEGESGTHTFEADAEGYTVDFGSDKKVDIIGRYVIEEGVMTIWDVGGNPDWRCPEGAKGRYNVSVSEKEMRMELIEDDCKGRGSQEVMVMTRK